jgi:hypothetical protein
VKPYIIKTNFGHTYLIKPEQVAKDYAEIMMQFEGQDGIEESFRKTREQWIAEIISDQDHLDQWYYDQIGGDVGFIMDIGELISVDQETHNKFFRFAACNFGVTETE